MCCQLRMQSMTSTHYLGLWRDTITVTCTHNIHCWSISLQTVNISFTALLLTLGSNINLKVILDYQVWWIVRIVNETHELSFTQSACTQKFILIFMLFIWFLCSMFYFWVVKSSRFLILIQEILHIYNGWSFESLSVCIFNLVFFNVSGVHNMFLIV